MFIVVIGCGRTGSRLAGLLSKKGHDVVVVDKNNEGFAKLPIEFSGFRVEGDALEQEVLKSAKMGQADIVVVTTENDKVNHMVAQLASVSFNVPLILVRVVSPGNLKLFKDDPSVETLSPILLMVDKFMERIEGNEG